MSNKAESSINKFSLLFKDRQLNAPTAANDDGAESDTASSPDKTAPSEIVEDSAPKAKTGKTRKAKTLAPVRLKALSKQEKKELAKADSKKPRKRGRPANGKRSDPNWHGRTFYIRKQTDDLLESALFKLKREGIELDKSQLVDALLNAWSQVELDQANDFCIGEILEKPNSYPEDD